jgi:hypothetical protein
VGAWALLGCALLSRAIMTKPLAFCRLVSTSAWPQHVCPRFTHASRPGRLPVRCRPLQRPGPCTILGNGGRYGGLLRSSRLTLFLPPAGGGRGPLFRGKWVWRA